MSDSGFVLSDSFGPDSTDVRRLNGSVRHLRSFFACDNIREKKEKSRGEKRGS